MRARSLVMGLAIVLIAAACGNSGSSKESSDTTVPAGGPTSTASAADLKKNVPVVAPGVTDTEIDVATIVTKTNNPTGASYGPLVDGIKAYFEMINETNGGIYGRKLVVKYDHDDGFNNQQVVKASLAQDKAFATFIADALFTGAAGSRPGQAADVRVEHQPRVRGAPDVLRERARDLLHLRGRMGTPTSPRASAPRRSACSRTASRSSRRTARPASRTRSPSTRPRTVEFFDDSLGYAQPVGTQVQKMKAKGITLVFTCVDLNESYTLAKEMQKQNMKAVQQLPNGYDAAFVAKNKDVLEGDVITLQFVALEVTPQIPTIQDLYKWTGKINVPVSELTVYGWALADELYTGLVGAGTELLAGRGRQRAEPAEGVERQRLGPADRLGQGPHRPREAPGGGERPGVRERGHRQGRQARAVPERPGQAVDVLEPQRPDRRQPDQGELRAVRP